MSLRGRLVTIILVTLIATFIVLPPAIKSQYFPFLGDFWINLDIRKGLDLAGGSQLDYKIDMRGIAAKDRDSVINGVMNVIEKRVNKLGAKEPNIYRSDVAGEAHVIVELAGISDLDEAKATVGKVVQLEFKEQLATVDPNTKTKVKAEADETLKSLLNGTGSSFAVIGQELALETGKKYETKEQFKSELPTFLQPVLPTLKNGQINTTVLEQNDASYEVKDGQMVPTTAANYVLAQLESTSKELNSNNPAAAEDFLTVAKSVSSSGTEFKNVQEEALPADLKTVITALMPLQISDIVTAGDKLYLVKLLDKKAAVEAADEVHARHILISYQGAERADAKVTRTKEEAQKLAQEVLEKAQQGQDFKTLAGTYTDDPSGKTTGGDLGFFAKGAMVPAFEEAVWNLSNNAFAAVTETPFGFHVIQKLESKATPATPATYSYAQIALPVAEKTQMEALEKRVKEDIKYKYSVISFSTKPDDWKAALGKSGTALTGKYFKRAEVTSDQGMNYAVSIEFNDEGAKLFEEITERLVNKPLAIFVGGELISSPTVREKISAGKAQISGNFSLDQANQLARDLNTGAIAAPIVLAGQQTVGATLGAEALDSSLLAGLIGLILVAIFMLVYYAVPGLLADIALVLYTVVVVAVVKIFGVVMTLAGIAAVIMSIGIAVDANVLIFERLKEEIRKGKNIASAIDLGFERAWSSIRDSNVSSVITAVILFWFGSSIIRGFALMLIIGILVSLFSAIFITRALLQLFLHTKWGKNPAFYGVRASSIQKLTK